MNVLSSVFGRGAENELRLVNEKGEPLQCLDHIDVPSTNKITRPIVLEIRDILQDSGLYASKEDLCKRVKPELDTEQFELISTVHRDSNALVHETEDILGYLEYKLHTRYGDSISLDQSVYVPSFAGYIPHTSTILGKSFPHLVDQDAYRRYEEADHLLTNKNVRHHTNILGRHTNISFTSKQIAETFFRCLNSKIRKIIANSFSGYPYTHPKRFESYTQVCKALEQPEMVLDDEKPIFDEHGAIPFSYHLVRFKEFKPGRYGVELRISDAITSSAAVKNRIEEELLLLFS